MGGWLALRLSFRRSVLGVVSLCVFTGFHPVFSLRFSLTVGFHCAFSPVFSLGFSLWVFDCEKCENKRQDLARSF